MGSTIPDLLASIRAELELEQLGTTGGIRSARRFFQEQVDPYGVAAAAVKQIERRVYREVKSWPAADRNKLATALFRSGKLEEGILVSYLYQRYTRQCGRCELHLFESWLDRYVTNWAHTDAICYPLTSACIANQPELASEPAAWTASKNRWKRRGAAVTMVKAGKAGLHTAAIFEIASKLMEDEDVMVQKGTGWLLKETYPKRRIETVRFLMEWKDKTTRLVLRYAAEKMSEADRQRVLG